MIFSQTNGKLYPILCLAAILVTGLLRGTLTDKQ